MAYQCFLTMILTGAVKEFGAQNPSKEVQRKDNFVLLIYTDTKLWRWALLGSKKQIFVFLYSPVATPAMLSIIVTYTIASQTII